MLLKDLVVSPCNVRDTSNADEEISQLKDSIKEHTLISKIILRPGKSGKFEIIAGQRRYKVLCELLGANNDLPEEDYVLMQDLDDEQATLLSISENTQRLALSPMELNRIALKLNSWGYKDAKIAKVLNVTPHRLKRIITLSQNLSRLPEEAKQELRKPVDESKFHDGHLDKMKDMEDTGIIKDVVDYIMDKESPPRDVPSIIKAMEKKYDQENPPLGDGDTGKKKSPEEPSADGPIEYVHKGELKLEINGDEKILKVIGKGVENESENVPVEHYLEYLMHPEKFRCFVSFKLKIKPVD